MKLVPKLPYPYKSRPNLTDKMDDFDIHDYLENYNKENRRGTCKVCLQSVIWKKESDLQLQKSKLPRNFTAGERIF